MIRRLSKPARITMLWLVAAVVLGGVAVGDRPPTRAAFTQLQPSDKLMHAPRGDAAGVMRFAQAVGSYRMSDTRAYVYEIYRLAPLVGLDPAILIGQSALETGYWRGKFWISDLNPAGIGIYDDNQPTSFHWATGTDAARGHIYHLYTYAAGVPPRGHPLYPYRYLTPGADGAVRLGFAGTKTTIQSLEGSWALMSLYALGLCNKANEILGYAEDTAPTATRTTTRTATPRPSMTPTRTPCPVDDVAASDGNDPRRAVDRDLATSWAVLGNGSPPAGGQLTIDLGKPIRLSSIRWVFRRTGFADYLSIRGSVDGATWTTLKVEGNAPAGEWQTLKTTATARYVRLVLRNPNLDPSLGYLAEVAIHGSPAPAATALPTTTVQATETSVPGAPATASTTSPPRAAAIATPTATASATPLSIEPTTTLTATPVPATATATVTSEPPTATATATVTPEPPTATATETPIPPTETATATPTDTAVPETATVTVSPP